MISCEKLLSIYKNREKKSTKIFLWMIDNDCCIKTIRGINPRGYNSVTQKTIK